MSPVALCTGIAKGQFILQALFDRGGSAANFAGDEVFSTTRRFVIEQNAVDCEQAMRFPVDAHHLCSESLGTAVGVNRGEGRRFGLRNLAWPTKQLAGCGMEKARWIRQVAQDFQQAQGAHGGEFTGGFGNFETEADVALPGEMVKLLRFDLEQHPAQGSGVVEVGVMQKEAPIVDRRIGVQVSKAAAFEATGAAYGTVHVVALTEQQLGQIRAVLTGNSSDKGNLGHSAGFLNHIR